MIVTALGIDPGLANTGWSIVSRNRRGEFRVIDSGCIETVNTESEAKRVHHIYGRLINIINDNRDKLNLMAVERVFFNNNPSSCLSTAGVGYICILAAAQFDVPHVFYRPQEVKSAVGCGHKADKRTVSKFVSKITGADINNWHVADATATAIAGLLEYRSPREVK